MSRPAVFLVFVVLALAGCSSPSNGPEETTSAPPSTTAAQGPQPEWDLQLPELPATGGEPANQWVRGGDLDPSWNVQAGTGPGWFQLVWLLSDTDRDPAPGYSCGASFGTQTDFDVVHHAVRTVHDHLVQPGSVALWSRSSRDASTSCGGKQHVSVDAAGNGTVRGEPYHEPLPVFVATNGSVMVKNAGLWLEPGQTAVVRVDAWENQTSETDDGAASAQDGAGLQQPQATNVHVTGLTRVVHLGAWSLERIWVIPTNVCGNEPDVEDRSQNCVDRGSGP